MSIFFDTIDNLQNFHNNNDENGIYLKVVKFLKNSAQAFFVALFLPFVFTYFIIMSVTRRDANYFLNIQVVKFLEIFAESMPQIIFTAFIRAYLGPGSSKMCLS